MRAKRPGKFRQGVRVRAGFEKPHVERDHPGSIGAEEIHQSCMQPVIPGFASDLVQLGMRWFIHLDEDQLGKTPGMTKDRGHIEAPTLQCSADGQIPKRQPRQRGEQCNGVSGPQPPMFEITKSHVHQERTAAL